MLEAEIEFLPSATRFTPFGSTGRKRVHVVLLLELDLEYTVHMPTCQHANMPTLHAGGGIPHTVISESCMCKPYGHVDTHAFVYKEKNPMRSKRMKQVSSFLSVGRERRGKSARK